MIHRWFLELSKEFANWAAEPQGMFGSVAQEPWDWKSPDFPGFSSGRERNLSTQTWSSTLFNYKNIDPENGQKSVETQWQLMATNDPITPAIRSTSTLETNLHPPTAPTSWQRATRHGSGQCGQCLDSRRAGCVEDSKLGERRNGYHLHIYTHI